MQEQLFGNLIDMAIERIRLTEPPEGYWLAYSGGKDSTVLLWLAQQSGVKFDAHYNVTGIDQPELVRFIRTVPGIQWERAGKSFMQLFMEHGFPLRTVRWCCRELKEKGGVGRITLTGVRWQESARRQKIHQLIDYRKGKTLVNPIIDWHSDDIWACIRENKLSYCSLYDEGWKRLGCVLCPNTRRVAEQMVRWPKTTAVWKRAFYRFFEKIRDCKWSSAEALWQAWLDRDSSLKGDLVEEKECELFTGAGISFTDESK